MKARIPVFDVLRTSLDGIRLIEASAGTGKTWNICGLYLRLLLERRLEVQKILVVTFTNAATAELRERVRSRLAEVLECLRGRPTEDSFARQLIDAVARSSGTKPEEMQALLEAALSCFDEAAIYTIHGFCQRALAETPLAAGLPYGLEMLEDDAQLRQEAVADFWRREVSGKQGDPDLAAWLVRREESPAEWAKLLQRLQAKPLSRQVWPEAIDDPVEPLRAPLDAAFAAAKRLWEAERKAAVETLVDLPEGTLHRGLYKRESIEAGAVEWDTWLASEDPLYSHLDEKKACLFSAAHLTQKTNKSGRGRTPRHRFFDAAAALLECRERMEAQLERLRLRLLRQMAQETLVRLRQIKRARRVIGFDDMLYNAWDALCNGARPWLAAELRNRYPVALIDEFQDTDPLQCAIFFAIYGTPKGPGTLYLVGDPKQAIYSFRNADLHTYLGAKERAQPAGALLANQRSVAGLIEATNALFGANPSAFLLPNVAYHAVRAGERKRPPLLDADEGESAAPLRLWCLPAGAQGEYLSRDEAHALAVQATAAEIARLLRAGEQGRITLDGRGLLGGDIAVLVRTHRQGRWIKEALAALNIGSVELSQESLFATRDAEDLERVLSSILEPARRPRLLAAVATEFLGLSAGEIEALAADDASLAGWTARFDELRSAWLARGFGVMFRRWIEECAVSERLLARADGERRMTNLLHLGELLQRKSQEQPSPAALLRWLASQRAEAASNEEAQLRLESDRNLVQIATIHKAKGLEYPVVFCPFAWDGFLQLRPTPYAIEYHDEDGNAVLDFRPDAAKEEEIRKRRRKELAAERVRLTYVALTRAIYRCYVVAGCYGTSNRGGTASFTESSRSILNWLACASGDSYEDWLEQKRSPAQIEESWKRIAEAGAPHILLQEIPAARGSALRARAADRDRLSALAAPERIDPGWRIGSFTALATGAMHEAAASDHDARAIAPAETVPPADLAEDDILRFPRGPSAGDCVHAAFERADFMDPGTWDGAIHRALALHPQRPAAALPLQRRMLRSLLGNVLRSQLPDGIVLGQVPAARRLNELAFHLPAPELSAARLNAWLRANGYPAPRLAFDTLRGYLSGFIDLTFESGGRYYVLDWKSNHLGFSRDDYRAERVAAAMQEHGYSLQAALYSLAVHRYLAHRLRGYDYERHFGGVLYLFVRGVRPGWLDAEGFPLGTWFHRPAAKALASLQDLLGTQRKAA